MANKRVLVDPPPFTPLRFGLLSTAIDRTAEAPDKWRTGVTWQSHCPVGEGTYDPCLVVTREESPAEVANETDVPNPPDKVGTSELVHEEEGSFFLRGATPFAVYTRFDCSPVGIWEVAQDLAVQAITRVESHEVERIFATGVAPTDTGAIETAYPHLQGDTPLIDDTGAVLQTVAEEITSTPLDIVEALGRLESALGQCYFGRGVVHVPAVLSADLATHGLVTRRGDELTTLLGNRVAIGTGYPGASPAGVEEPDVAWIYATGAVFYYRSEVRVGQLVESFDRNRNTVQMLAERTYVIGWDCCHLAVPVHIGGIEAGGFDTAGPIEMET
jgi:hypothetical protein